MNNVSAYSTPLDFREKQSRESVVLKKITGEFLILVHKNEHCTMKTSWTHDAVFRRQSSERLWNSFEINRNQALNIHDIENYAHQNGYLATELSSGSSALCFIFGTSPEDGYSG